MKRLEQDRFIWPHEAVVPTLTVEQLHWLLDGIDLASRSGTRTGFTNALHEDLSTNNLQENAVTEERLRCQ